MTLDGMSKMFAQERKRLILKTLEEKKRVTISELEDLLHVSGTTIRNDLSELEASHLLVRTHGGAMWVDHVVSVEETIDDRQGKKITEKEEIAKLACLYVHEHDTIFLDTGTTCFQIAVAFSKLNRSLTIITNDMRVALQLQKSPKIHVIVLGGSMRNGFECTLGAETILSLMKYSFDEAFLAANGISLEQGMTTPDLETAKVKEVALTRSQHNYLVVDHDKFEKVTATKFGDLEDIDAILTDSKIDSDLLSLYENNHMTIIHEH